MLGCAEDQEEEQEDDSEDYASQEGYEEGFPDDDDFLFSWRGQKYQQKDTCDDPCNEGFGLKEVEESIHKITVWDGYTFCL